jgi:hypothetical protein
METHLKAFKYVLVVLLFGAGAGVQAGIPEDVEEKLTAEVDTKLVETLKLVVEEKALAERFGFDHPVMEPKVSQSAVEGLIDAEITKQSREKFPKSWYTSRYEKMKPNFLVWRLGDVVEGKRKAGRPFSGRLRDIEKLHILVDNQKILRKELTPDTLIHIDAKQAGIEAQKAKEDLIQQLRAMRKQYGKEIRTEITRDKYSENGYILVSGTWKSKKHFFQERLEAERDFFAKYLRPKLKYKIFYNAGYREFEEKWYTPEEVSKLRALEKMNAVEIMAELDLLNREGRLGLKVSSAERAKYQGEDEEIAPQDDGFDEF